MRTGWLSHTYYLVLGRQLMLKHGREDACLGRVTGDIDQGL